MAKLRSSFFLLISLFTCVASANSKDVSFGSVFEDYLAQKMPSKIPGYVVGIITDEGVYKITSGVREKGKPEPFDSNSVFRLASVSKTFTPSAALALRNPKLSFENTVSASLTDLVLSDPDYQQKITLGHLLSQTSGLVPHAYTNLVQDNVPYEKIVEKLSNVDFICKPGSCYSYQNIVYNLAGDMLAKAENSSYETIVEQQLFGPLAMDGSSIGFESFLQEENRATPHKWDKQLKVWSPTQVKDNYYQLSSAAGVNSNLNDMLEWIKVQLGLYPQVLNKEELDILHSPQVKTSRNLAHYKRESWDGVTNFGYAYGWRTFDFKGQVGFVHHGGWVDGFRVEMVINRQLNLGLFFVTNSEPKIASDIVPEFISMYLKYADISQ